MSIDLQILATSDVHGALTPVDKPGSRGCLSKISTLVQDIQSDHRNCLLLDNGDFLQGSALCDFAANDGPETDKHPIIAAMNHLGYDAAGLGNHEFDYGIAFLNTALAGATFPVLSANIHRPEQSWRKSCILSRTLWDSQGHPHELRIGVFSVQPEQVTVWNARHLKDKVETEDIINCAVNTAKELRADGADLVICLLHSGISGSNSTPRMENAAIPVARLADIDALVCGHSHHELPVDGRDSSDDVDFANGLICGVPTIMPGFDAAFLGQISLQVTQRDQGYFVYSSHCRLVPANTAEDDTELNNQLAADQHACAALLRSEVGYLHLPIHSFYSRLPGDCAVALVGLAQLEYARQHLMSYLPDNVPLLSAASPYKGGGRGGPGNFAMIPIGPVTQADLNQLQPFQNSLVALQMTAAQLMEWLEMSASCFHTVQPGSSGTPLRNAGFPCYGFDTVFGVSYEIDPTQPARYDVFGTRISDAKRIRNLTWQASPIADDQRFVFLTNSYRAGGGGYFPGAADMTRLDIPITDSRDIIANVLSEGINEAQLPSSPWHFTTQTNATAIALIGPGIQPAFDQGYRPEVPLILGPTDPQGFLQCTVSIGHTPT